jgi:reactive intermediate/imine deaminase
VSKKVLRPSNLSFLPRRQRDEIAYPFSSGAAAGGWVFTCGLVAWDEDGKIIAPGDTTAQTRQVLTNLESVLREGGASLSDVLKCNCYLADIRNIHAMNVVFEEFFPDDPPARTTVQVPLATPEMVVEIEAVAYTGS